MINHFIFFIQHLTFFDLSLSDLLLQLVCGLIFGICMTMTGVGGGILLIPILQLAFGLTPVSAVGTASVISSLSRIYATYAHIRSNNVTWKPVVYLLIGAVPLTLLTAHFVVLLSNHIAYTKQINQFTHIFILLVMIGAFLLMLSKALKHNKKQNMDPLKENKPYFNKHANVKPQHDNYFSKLKAILLGAFCGFVLGVSGIGGGILILPALNNGLDVPIKKSVGSAIVIALVLSVISAISYSKGGQSDITIAVTLVCGSFFGNAIAMRLLKLVSDRFIYLFTISILMLSIVLTLFT